MIMFLLVFLQRNNDVRFILRDEKGCGKVRFMERKNFKTIHNP